MNWELVVSAAGFVELSLAIIIACVWRRQRDSARSAVEAYRRALKVEQEAVALLQEQVRKERQEALLNRFSVVDKFNAERQAKEVAQAALHQQSLEMQELRAHLARYARVKGKDGRFTGGMWMRAGKGEACK